MLEVGSIVNAQLERVEPYGGYFRYGNEQVFVDHGFYSWEPGGDPLEAKAIGDSVPVRILGYDYKQRVTVGSLKHVDPEANPYRHLSRLDPDTIFEGTVTRVDRQGATVVLSRNIWGRLSEVEVRRRPVHVGERLRLRIFHLDVEAGRLTLQPVDENNAWEEKRSGVVS